VNTSARAAQITLHVSNSSHISPLLGTPIVEAGYRSRKHLRTEGALEDAPSEFWYRCCDCVNVEHVTSRGIVRSKYCFARGFVARHLESVLRSPLLLQDDLPLANLATGAGEQSVPDQTTPSVSKARQPTENTPVLGDHLFDLSCTLYRRVKQPQAVRLLSDSCGKPGVSQLGTPLQHRGPQTQKPSKQRR